MALDDFLDGTDAFDHLLVHGPAFKVEPDIGAGGIAQALGVDIKSAACNDSVLNKMLYTLVYGGT